MHCIVRLLIIVQIDVLINAQLILIIINKMEYVYHIVQVVLMQILQQVLDNVLDYVHKVYMEILYLVDVYKNVCLVIMHLMIQIYVLELVLMVLLIIKQEYVYQYVHIQPMQIV